jgi:FKBP-type peptidyl-prolyl cis-trans isomerase
MRFPAPILMFVLLTVVGCSGGDAAKSTAKTDGKGETPATSTAALTELKTEDVKVGTGTAVGDGDTVFMKYTGKLANGTVFDSNDKEGGQPISFTLGPNASVVEGWNKGIAGMKKGGKRKLSIPAKMGYGAEAKGPIPANSDLYFDVELLGYIRSGEENTVVKSDKKVGTGKAVANGQKITVKYKGTLVDGSTFDEGSFSFTVGKAEVIPGFDAGVIGMKKGGIRDLVIPPMAGYGPMGSPPKIPGNALLNFTIEVVQIG